MSNLQGSLRFGDFVINRRMRELRRLDTVLPLSGKAFDLLVYMASNYGRPLSKSELLDAVWPETAVEEANLSQNVFLLRKVLGGSNGPIKTLPGHGYQFAAEVTEIEATPAAESRQARAASEPSLTLEATQTRMVVQHDIEEHISLRPSRQSIIIVSAILFVLLGWLGWLSWQSWLDRTGGPPISIVLSATDGTTGDPILDRSLIDALRLDLAQSPYVSLISSATLRATLTQMLHRPDEVLTPVVAREVCERANGQAVLAGRVARSGKRFLLIEEATSCVDGTVLAAAKQEADSAEDLPHGIDKLAAEIRRKLGESRRSIARFNMPLFPANTPSLDALKAYSQASYDAERGKRPEAIELLKQAIAADPRFAMAYFDLATAYRSQGDSVQERAAIEKAYSIRDAATEPIRFAITARYNTLTTGDLFAAERNFRSWTELYPRSATAWNSLSNVQRELGQNADSLASSEHAMALTPHNQSMLVNLASRQMRNNKTQAARATLDSAIAQGLDGDRVRNQYLELAFLMQDEGLMQTQSSWAAAHPEAVYCILSEAQIASAEGRRMDAQKLITKAVSVLRQQGFSAVADSMVRVEGMDLLESGEIEKGTQVLHSVPADPEDGWYLVGLVESGDVAGAAAQLHTMLAKYPQGTLWNLFWAPRIEAGIDLANHKPLDAIAHLERSRALDGRETYLPTFRGDTYLGAAQPKNAESEYRKVVEHPEIEPASANVPLSWLGLGRALAAQGDRKGALDAYQRFFKLWAHADPDFAPLRKAKAEFAELEKAH